MAADGRPGGEVAAQQGGNGGGGDPVAMAPILQAPDISQATVTEVGRAAAEVQALVMVAQARPRDIDRARAGMLRSCALMGAEPKRVFFRFPRGSSYVTGPTVALMREIMRCWGNCQAGATELRRWRGGSEMQAWAWDMEANVRMVTTFVVPHIRERSDDAGGTIALADDAVRDIYELNANLAARRERAMITRILPVWYVDEAERAARAAVAGPPDNWPQQIAKALAWFSARGVSEAMLVNKLGAPRKAWAGNDLVTLRTIVAVVSDDPSRLAGEFPGMAGKGSAAATLAQAKAAQPASGPGDAGAPADPPAGEPAQPAEPPQAGDQPANGPQAGPPAGGQPPSGHDDGGSAGAAFDTAQPTGPRRGGPRGSRRPQDGGEQR